MADDSVEIKRRRDLLERLRREYILSHDGISPGLIAGTELPPDSWINQRLKELTERWTVADNKKDKPDIGLALVYRKLPALLITNPSTMTANAPKYSVILWNLDSDRRDPLPIPVQVALGDYVVPRASWGPNNILDTDLVRPLRKEGDRLFGYIRVQCADCMAVRDYWAFIRVGENGWYAKLPEDKHVDNNSLLKLLPELRKDFDRTTSDIPVESRISIE